MTRQDICITVLSTWYKIDMMREERAVETLIEVKNLMKIYNPGENEVRALNDVSLTIMRGEFVAIIGQSGSGKSTFMNMLGCLDVPTSGSYFLNGKDVAGLTDDELSALENVELPLIYRNVPAAKRYELSVASLTRVGLEHRMDHKPSEMSGGQQQRVAIARALAAAPPVILADEPTGNLDSASSKEIMQILRDLYKEGRTVILITHDNKIAASAKRVIRIIDGKIVSDISYDEDKSIEEIAKQIEEEGDKEQAYV